jgi:glycosyltransferase involved in cell wall biosynthesis
MRILHVSNKSDIRAFKQAVIMLGRGHIVDMAVPFAQTFGFNAFELVYLYSDVTHLQRTIRESKADIFHVHSDPNWLVPMVKEAAGHRPVIHDVHDPESMRTGRTPDKHEIAAMTVCDGIIHVSQGCREHCEKTHGATKPTEIIYSMVPEAGYKANKNANFDAIVYQGGLTTLERTPDGMTYFRNLQPVVKQFIEQGFQFSLFAAGQDDIDLSYEKMGAFLTRNLNYTTMLNALRLHGFGFVGTPVLTPIMKYCMPNKLFEYISQGVVPVCWNADEAGEFVKENGIGIHLKGDLSELRIKLKDGMRIREKLVKNGKQFAMESQTNKLEQFYKSFL